ncbi:hypothetical protein HQ45_05425 [Porphyromonas crevioricanis]|uniref:Uncharacterized protein n=1 Tax=Porphyromonas crevioricanis JCM 15906 TaxID=1305617 RepID=T1DSY2_9PORP|nr:hypothetical protein [Porphyromonas crevioricanis]KGN90232.1 hypothetical protein HQ45_05425 [Porphyromonas crevioricanis]GAD05905.1 hypothetical protein PORCRE_1615 [Porphyromonas crevioricanis JCM 15906]SKA03232.1 hypothetical protein SAMN02745203_01665 [Porphyromonas crevioricanis]
MERIQQNKFADGFFNRIAKILHMEIQSHGKNLLTLGLIIMGAIFVGEHLLFYVNGSKMIAFDHALSFTACSMALFVFYTYRINRRVNGVNPIAYTILPASNLEKFISMWIIGLVLFVFSFVISQLAYTLTWISIPNGVLSLNSLVISGAPKVEMGYTTLDFKELYNGALSNPGFFFLLTSSICSSIFFRRYLVAVFSCIAMYILLAFGYSLLISNIGDIMAYQKELRWSYLLTIGGLALLFFFLSYHSLKRKQI